METQANLTGSFQGVRLLTLGNPIVRVPQQLVSSVYRNDQGKVAKMRVESLFLFFNQGNAVGGSSDLNHLLDVVRW